MYKLAIETLAIFEKPIPFYRPKVESHDSIFSTPMESWTEAQVSQWISKQRFSMYESLFSSGWVDGNLLSTISDSDLEKMGIKNPMHRKRILSTIENHKTTSGGSSQLTPISSSSSTNLSKDFIYDAFISYRRSNGSQLSQLLKVCLRQEGFNVFLDVDELGLGEFDVGLLSKLKASRCVILVLTENSLDRCFIGADPENKDWVRKEIATAIQENIQIIPVTHDFLWPDPESLPSDIRKVTSFNAVNWSHDYMGATLKKLSTFIQGVKFNK